MPYLIQQGLIQTLTMNWVVIDYGIYEKKNITKETWAFNEFC